MAKKFDIADFNDPVAEKTSWLPLKTKLDSSLFYSLSRFSSTQYRYQYSLLIRIVVISLGLIGALYLWGGIDSSLSRGITHSYSYFIIATVCFAFPIYFYKFVNNYKVFDLGFGCYWVGGKKPKFSGRVTKKNRITYLDKVHAIQILSELVPTTHNRTLLDIKNQSYFSYELNLVLKNGSRVNVLDHDRKAQVLKDANLLSLFLNIPIWDVSI